MNISVFQIYFSAWQLEGLDPDFLPYDNSKCPNPDWREFYVFRKEFLKGLNSKSSYTGYVSWKFLSKTGLSGKRFLDFCRAHPGADVYFVNPFPLAIHLGNIWNHGEAFHPGLTDIAQHIFDAVGYNVELNKLPINLRTMSFCNFWVGNQKFWDAYMAYCLPIWDYIEKDMPGEWKRKLFATADSTIKASYFAYIFERLFTTFLIMNPEIKSCAYQFSSGDLTHYYDQDEMALIKSMQTIESQFPHELEPLRHNPAVISALHYYFVSTQDRRIWKPLLFKVAQAVWHMVPFRLRLLRLIKFGASTKLIERRIRPKLSSPFSVETFMESP